MASLYINDAATAQLVARVAKHSGVTKTALVRELVAGREAELNQTVSDPAVRERIEEFWRRHPMPPRTDLVADKAFFDDLSGNL